MNRVVHFEIHAEDPQRAILFYAPASPGSSHDWGGGGLLAGHDRSEGGAGNQRGPHRLRGRIDGEAVIAYVCTIEVHRSTASSKGAERRRNGAQAKCRLRRGLARYARHGGKIFGMMQTDPSAHESRDRHPRLRLRPCREEDLPALHALWTEPEVRRYLWDGEVIPSERAMEILAKSEESFRTHGFGLWSAFVAGEPDLAGFAGLRVVGGTEEVEILYGLHPRLWGLGLATEAADALIAQLSPAAGRNASGRGPTRPRGIGRRDEAAGDDAGQEPRDRGRPRLLRDQSERVPGSSSSRGSGRHEQTGAHEPVRQDRFFVRAAEFRGPEEDRTEASTGEPGSRLTWISTRPCVEPR